MPTAIEWTDETWNPVTGCTKVSPGCKFCYAERITERWGQDFKKVVLHPKRLDQPLHWRKPRRIFVNSMSDLFHPAVPDQFIFDILKIMIATPQHTFQVLTKRPERMATVLPEMYKSFRYHFDAPGPEIPLRNLWLGTSCEDQKTADERIPWLLKTSAAVRFLSLEPLLGPIDLRKLHSPFLEPGFSISREVYPLDGLMAIPDNDWSVPRVDWVIAGGESGGPPERALVEKAPCRCLRSSRPYHLKECGAFLPKPDTLPWVRSIRDQCVAAGVPFFFKQFGGPTPKAGGRLLDGKIWDEYPA